MLYELSEIIMDRKVNQPAGSYTTHLFSAGQDEILKKLGEEVIEVILASKGQGNERLVQETADMVYHLLVLLAWHGISFEAVEVELRRRHHK